ncbi:hypothetical protein [Kordia jejudonensis]|uniref:hypothetical protein n=1 Tax=Kordia jejudonensis TaxID=1348245 RepID=UPI00062997FC|nr:hypothetical protein [Kordia jejudonensis]
MSNNKPKKVKIEISNFKDLIPLLFKFIIIVWSLRIFSETIFDNTIIFIVLVIFIYSFFRKIYNYREKLKKEIEREVQSYLMANTYTIYERKMLKLDDFIKIILILVSSLILSLLIKEINPKQFPNSNEIEELEKFRYVVFISDSTSSNNYYTNKMLESKNSMYDDYSDLLHFSTNDTMVLGENYSAEAFFNFNNDLKSQDSISTKYNLYPYVKKGSQIKMKLKYANKDFFEITDISSPSQIMDSLTSWQWNIQPQNSGLHNLFLVPTLIKDDFSKDLTIVSKKVYVKSNYMYSTKKFITDNTEFFITAIILPILFWLFTLINNRRKKKEKEKEKEKEKVKVNGFTKRN